MAVKVTYLDNSGFLLETPDVFLVFDYMEDPSHDVKKALESFPEKPIVFFVSHDHHDHFNPVIFNLAQSHKRVYVLSNDIVPRLVPDTLDVAWMQPGGVTDRLPAGVKVQAFGSTDSGVSYAVTLADGTTIFHAGDLNNWHWNQESTPRESHQAEQAFTVIVDRIAEVYPKLDIAFFPVDVRQGPDSAAGAEQFLSKIAVQQFFPMHFKGRYEKACDFSAYKLMAEVFERTKMNCLHKPGQSVELKFK